MLPNTSWPSRSTRGPSLSDQLSQWLDEILYRLIMKGSSIPGGWFTIAILALLVVAAFVVAVRIARRTMRTNRGNGRGLFGTHELSAAEHRATAQAHAAQGNWAAAIRHGSERWPVSSRRPDCSTRSQGAQPASSPTTPANCYPSFSADLRRAATVFNDVTYGEQPGTEADYRMVADLDDGASPSLRAVGRQALPTPRSADTWAPLR